MIFLYGRAFIARQNEASRVFSTFDRFTFGMWDWADGEPFRGIITTRSRIESAASKIA
jgi:hypothetical protein